ncbi:CD48 antigen isoform X2 [Tupaia chinensis]|uniref:CD48 antigen isoform X2 n=1 Tax=Tupaia chinensis TaxID=246437 RepID=UPI0003C8C66A|nr:CD48 antigen isoform X2 [Tupaia chinensis]
MCSRRWCLDLKLLLPLLFLAISIQDHSVPEMFKLSGSNVTLQISESLPQDYKRLTWFYSHSQKIIEWEHNQPRTFGLQFRDRVQLIRQSGALHITNVQREDSSTYFMRVLKTDGKLQEWKITLKVLDPVPQPSITIVKAKKEHNTCYLNLSCVVPDQSVNYRWYDYSGLLPKELQSSRLEIIVRPENFSKFYICEVSNPVSSKYGTVCFTSLCIQAGSPGITWFATCLEVMVPILLGFHLTLNELI